MAKKKTNYDYTAKERKQREREEMSSQGFKRKEYWVHIDDEEKANRYMEKLKNSKLKP